MKPTSPIRIGDLPANVPLDGLRFIYPGDGQPYYWVSQWEKGVWGRKQFGDTRIYPLFVDSLDEALEWEVIS